MLSEHLAARGGGDVLGKWVEYVRGRGLLDDPDPAPVRFVAGGVSGVVVQVGNLLCKQPRERLAVDAEWTADPRRVLAEAEAMSRLPGIAPAVLDLNRDKLILVQEFLPGTVWKEHLLRGEADLGIARRLGQVLARIHQTDPAGLDGQERLRTLRLAPYFQAAAAARPELAGELTEVVARLDIPGEHLVHGDFSPKNLLVDAGDVRVIDWEVVHAGDPAFDLAFLVSHLAGKAIRRPDWAARYAAAAREFDQAYGSFDRLWRDRLVGALLVARADGISRFEYLDDAGRDTLRAIGSGLLRGRQTWPW